MPLLQPAGDGLLPLASSGTGPRLRLTGNRRFADTPLDRAISEIFTIDNLGDADLIVTGITPSTHFSLLDPLVFPITITPGNTDTFEIQADADSAGQIAGLVQIANNSGRNPYRFGIVVEVLAAEMRVSGDGLEILDGALIASEEDFTDFGTTVVDEPVTRTFLVENIGTDDLIDLLASAPDGFSITQALVASLAPGASDSFTVQADATEAGTFDGLISIANSDADENPYTFTIQVIVEEA